MNVYVERVNVAYFRFFFAFLAFFFTGAFFLAFFFAVIGMCDDSFYRSFGFRESRSTKREQYE